MMIDTGAVVTVATIALLGFVSPGPNFIVVAQRAMNGGREEALATAAGVASVSTLWAGASLFGLSVVFRLFPWLQLVLKVAGALYLILSVIKLWRGANRPFPAGADWRETRGGYAFAFHAGLATNLSNAKAIAFYTSVFSAAAPAPGQTSTLWTALALVSLLAFSWYGTVALVLSSGPVAAGYRRAHTSIERVCAALLIGFGIRLALSN